MKLDLRFLSDLPALPATIFKTSTVNGVMLCTFIAGMVILTQLYYM